MIKSGSVGGYDDDQFADGELVYRRVPDKPAFVIMLDPITGERRPTTAAFSIKDEPDGLSVHIHGLIRRFKCKTKDLCDWDSYGVARFEVGLVRPRLGVIGDEEPADSKLGKAHGLVRGPDGIPNRSVWNPVRDEILANLDFFESDPDPSTDSWSFVSFGQQLTRQIGGFCRWSLEQIERTVRH